MSRKKNFFLNVRDFFSYVFLKYLPKGPNTPQTKYFTASAKEEAIQISLKILATDHSIESIIIQNPQDPESGAIELRA